MGKLLLTFALFLLLCALSVCFCSSFLKFHAQWIYALFRRTFNAINGPVISPDCSNRTITSEVKFKYLRSVFHCIASHFNGWLLRFLRAIYCACRYNSYTDIELWNFLFHSELTISLTHSLLIFLAIIVFKKYLTYGPTLYIE